MSLITLFNFNLFCLLPIDIWSEMVYTIRGLFIYSISKEKHQRVGSEAQTRSVGVISDLAIVILTKRIVKKQRVKYDRKCGGNRCVPVSVASCVCKAKEARNPERFFILSCTKEQIGIKYKLT